MEIAQFILTLFMFTFLGGVLWYLKKNESYQKENYGELNKLLRKYFHHMMTELKVPEPEFHVKQFIPELGESGASIKVVSKPQVKRKSEDDEYNLELPPGSAKRVI